MEREREREREREAQPYFSAQKRRRHGAATVARQGERREATYVDVCTQVVEEQHGLR
jgi:hypothetical protein